MENICVPDWNIHFHSCLYTHKQQSGRSQKCWRYHLKAAAVSSRDPKSIFEPKRDMRFPRRWRFRSWSSYLWQRFIRLCCLHLSPEDATMSTSPYGVTTHKTTTWLFWPYCSFVLYPAELPIFLHRNSHSAAILWEEEGECWTPWGRWKYE
jgi:hypothetical protein